MKSLMQFDAMVSLPPCTCEAAKHFEKHNQLIKLMQFLMGLDESYLAIRSNILTREPLPLVKAAFAVVSGEESHRNATSIGATKPTTTAFVTKTFDNKRRPNDEGGVSSNDDGIELSPEFQGNDDSEATSMEENNNTHLEGNVSNEIDFVNDFYENSEFNSKVEELPVNTQYCHYFPSLNVNNAFLYGDLEEDVYMTIPQGFADKDNKNKSADDHSLFTKSKDNKFIALLVYVDDIVVTGNCVNEIDKIEVIKTGDELCLSQRKYCLGLLKEYGLLGCKHVSTPIEPTFVLPYIATSEDPLLDNITAYEIIWIQKLLFNLKTKVTLPVNLFCDNKSALQLAANPIFHERSKHFEIDVHFIREKKLQKGF
ncbi:ribonuclease H-like domain-containing protein [Tanacetum coccineum]